MTDTIDPSQLQRDLALTEAQFDAAAREQAGLFAHYSRLAAETMQKRDNLKNLLEVTEAQVARAAREDAAVKGLKITEKAIEEAVVLDAKIIKIKQTLASATANYEVAKAAVEAFRHKRDMIIHLGADRREEMKGTMRITAPSNVEVNEAVARLGERLRGKVDA